MPGLQFFLKCPSRVPHIRNAAGHPCREIASRGPYDHHPAAGHILTAVVPYTFNHRRCAGIAHRKTLAGKPRKNASPPMAPYKTTLPQ